MQDHAKIWAEQMALTRNIAFAKNSKKLRRNFQYYFNNSYLRKSKYNRTKIHIKLKNSDIVIWGGNKITGESL
ncbi:unnamed protein product [Blepharisma stoltei]|uniref:Ribosomal protein L20 n=1 Tax=Blepharisma stoltei TaxID=1481888 RepID=A0AAU9KCJ8_9CILI|nr:unnamed protein product [Blepharisma stoltei]